MTIKVTFVSTKGGVGNTTPAANLGGILADLGRKTLLIGVSSSYLIQSRATYGLTYLITESQVDNVICQATISGPNIMQSDDPQNKLQNGIRHMLDGQVRLEHILTCVEDAYNFILIDTPRAAQYRRPQHRGLPAGNLCIAENRTAQGLRPTPEKPCSLWSMNGLHTRSDARFGNLNKLIEK